MTFSLVFGQFMTGLAMGMVFFLIAFGLSLVFGTLGVLNVAHASLYMLGAFLCFSITKLLGSEMFWVALIFAPLGVALFSGILEIIVLRPIYKSDVHYQLILTFGLILIIGDICKFIWGRQFHIVEIPGLLKGTFSFLGISMSYYQTFMIFLGPVVLLLIWVLLHKTKFGKIVSAVTHSKQMSSSLGINVSTVYTAVFMLAGWIAGLAGTVMAPYSSVFLGMDFTVTIECFIIMVIGGLGSHIGAFLGAIIFGLVNALGILIMPHFAIAFGFIAMAAVLIVRPRGLLGKN
jgi:branched-chain amino acid transport system permease protein